MQPESPFNTIPPVILVAFVALMAVEAVLSLGSAGLVGGPGAIGWRITAWSDWGFTPGYWEQVWLRHSFAPQILARFVTYAFVHASFTHALFAGALMLALGKFVGDVMHWAAVLAVLLVATVAGAVVFGIGAGPGRLLIGAYPAVYGLIGAFTWLMWMRLSTAGQNRFMAFRLIGVLLAIQLLFAIFFGSDPSWIADLGGFGAGLTLAPFVAPGGWSVILARLRQR